MNRTENFFRAGANLGNLGKMLWHFSDSDPISLLITPPQKEISIKR